MKNSPESRNDGPSAEALRADVEKLRARLNDEQAAAIKMAAEIESLQERLGKAHHALEPRLLSILTLRPLRYALAERNRIKRELNNAAAGASALSFSEADRKRAVTRVAAAEIVEEVRAQAAERHASAAPTKATDIGIAVFAHNRAHHVTNVMHALDLQGACGLVHAFIDGDHGNPARRAQVDLVDDCISHYPVKQVHRNRGNFGFRKMMLLSMRVMMERYEKILFLEDDCFPTGGAIDGFAEALSSCARDDRIFSVYGHPFGIPHEGQGSARFQSWGWATTSEKLRPVWQALMDCYLQTEEEYLDFIAHNLTPEIEESIDVTPGRQPSETLKKFFAWDETLGLLVAMRGMRHQMTEKRLIYNFGAGDSAAHFEHVEYFRQPPFNMISADEVWSHF